MRLLKDTASDFLSGGVPAMGLEGTVIGGRDFWKFIGKQTQFWAL